MERLLRGSGVAYNGVDDCRPLYFNWQEFGSVIPARETSVELSFMYKTRPTACTTSGKKKATDDLFLGYHAKDNVFLQRLDLEYRKMVQRPEFQQWFKIRSCMPWHERREALFEQNQLKPWVYRFPPDLWFGIAGIADAEEIVAAYCRHSYDIANWIHHKDAVELADATLDTIPYNLAFTCQSVLSAIVKVWFEGSVPLELGDINQVKWRDCKAEIQEWQSAKDDSKLDTLEDLIVSSVLSCHV